MSEQRDYGSPECLHIETDWQWNMAASRKSAIFASPAASLADWPRPMIRKVELRGMHTEAATFKASAELKA